MNVKKTLLITSLSLVILGASACHRNDGPVERLGREVDDTISDATSSERSIGDKVGDGIKDLGDKIEDES